MPKMSYSNKCDKYSFIILSFLVFPISILSPISSWIPCLFCGILMFIFTNDKRVFFKNLSKEEILGFVFILFSISSAFWTSGKEFALIHTYEILILFLIFRVLFIKISLLKRKEFFIKVFITSAVLTSSMLVLDFTLSIGIKPWLSICFDQFVNGEITEYRNYAEFKKSYTEGRYIGSYSRGLSTICVFSFLILLISDKNKIKPLLYFTVIALSLFLGENLTVKIAFILSFLTGALIYIKRKLFFKPLIIILAFYFFSAPWTLNFFKNTEYNEFRKKIILQNHKTYQSIQDYEFNHSLKSYSNFIFLNSNLILNKTLGKISHRLIIWSYTSEKVLDNIFFGKGIFSSRKIGEDEKINLKIITAKGIDNNELVLMEKDNYYPAIPLHPHNNVLQIWLELGFFGVMIFFLLIYKILKFIIYSKDISDFQASILSCVLFSVILINQSSYGLWQIWWLSNLVLLIVFSKLLLKRELISESNNSYS